MQALFLDKTLTYREDLALPELQNGDALIKLRLAGICATDLELVKGYAGFKGILGHEFVGSVEKVASIEHHHWLGRRVVGSINIGCRTCDVCHTQGPGHCQNRSVLGIRGKNGVFADYFSLPVSNLWAVPETIPDSSAIFTEPLAAALQALEQLKDIEASRILVLGPGRLGLLIAKALDLAHYPVTLAGRSPTSLLLPAQWDLSTALIQNLPENQFDCVIDATGQSGGFEQALRVVKPRGRVILKSTFAAHKAIDLTKIVVGELQILGSRCGPFDKALELLAQNLIPLETMIDGCYPLHAGIKAFSHATKSGVRKIILQP